jgi:streptogramin lyase
MTMMRPAALIAAGLTIASCVVPTPSPSGGPIGLPIGGVTAFAEADGSLWVASTAQHAILRIDPTTNRVLGRYGMVELPVGLWAGSDGLWIADETGNLQRLDPRSGEVEANVTVDPGPSAVTEAGGWVWVADAEGAEVLRIDPRLAKVAGKTSVPAGPAALSAIGGEIWVVCEFAKRLVSIDVARGDLLSTIDAGLQPNSIATQPRRIWVADRAGARLLVIDPARHAIIQRINTGGPPLGLVSTQAGIFAAVGGAQGSVVRLGPSGDIVRISGAVSPSGAITVAFGAIWVAEASRVVKLPA